MSGHSEYVNGLAFSPGGKLLVSVSDDHTIKLWSLHDHIVLKTLSAHSESVFSVAISPDGRLLASGSDATSRLKSSLAVGSR